MFACRAPRPRHPLFDGTRFPRGLGLFGSSPSYGTTVACTPSPGSGTSPVKVSAQIGNLKPATTYHFTVLATNAGGTTRAPDHELRTLVKSTIVPNVVGFRDRGEEKLRP